VTRRALRLGWLAIAVVALTCIRAQPLLAQSSGRILLQVDPSLPPAVQERIPALYGELAPLLPPGTPPGPGDLAIVAQPSPAGMNVSGYDAVSAAPIFADEVTLEDGAIPSSYEDYLRERAQGALGSLSGRGAAPGEIDEGTGEGASDVASDEPTLAVTLGLGAGFGAYSNVVPTTRGPHEVAPSTFMAAALRLTVDARKGGFAPGASVQYRTSIGHDLSDLPPGGPRVRSAARVHELIVDLVGNVHFGRDRSEVSLPIALGIATRNLRLDEPLDTPGYTLTGLHAGFGFRIPFSDEMFVLALGPDLEWFLHVSDGLVARGFGWGGLAFGGFADLSLRLSERFALTASYRESHASVSGTATPQSFSDVQRFVTAGMAATY
jgi:hypothetical protein